MGKVFVVGDVHWSTYSSILRSRGNKCSTRLERLIESINWCEETAKGKGCDSVVYLGDFFDKPELTSEEISMLEEISWSDLPHFFIVGNHESDVASLEYNSTNVLRKHGFTIVSKPYSFANVLMLPYITEDSRKPFSEYVKGMAMPTVVMSHNDIKGIRYGMYESKSGFDVDEIQSNVAMYINGHIHNGTWVNREHTILNLGNICGQNFSEDAFEYAHRALVFDTNDLSCEFIENPHALNFYKLEVHGESDLIRLQGIKGNSVLSIKCSDSMKGQLKSMLDGDDRVLAYKLIVFIEGSDGQSVDAKCELSGMDYIDRFREFIIDNLGGDSVVMEELDEVCKA